MLIIRVQILNIDIMGNHIIGQTTDDIIEIIKLHCKLSVKVKNKDHVVNRNRYVRNK